MPRKPNRTSFKPGQSGNPNGRPKKGASLSDIMNEFLDGSPQGEKKTYKEIFVQKAYAKAVKEGDISAMRMIWNYVDGMPKQFIDHTTAGRPINSITNLTDDELAELADEQGSKS